MQFLQSCDGVRPLPAGTNPADWMLEVVGEVGKMVARQHRSGRRSASPGPSPSPSPSPSEPRADLEAGRASGSVADLALQFDASSYARTMKAGLAAFRSGDVSGSNSSGRDSPASIPAPERPGWCNEFWLVLWRAAVVSFRDVDYNTSRMIGLPVLAALFGVVFWQIDDVDQSATFSIIGAAFIGGLFAAVIGMNLAIVPAITTRPSLYREIDAGFYAPESQSLATTLVEVPWVAGLTLGYSAIIYFMVGLEPSQFWFFYATVLVLGLVFTFLGHTLAAVSPSQQIATAIATVAMGVQALFGGFLYPGPSMEPGWIWLHYLVPLRYGIGGLITPPFACDDLPDSGPAREAAIASLPAGAAGPCATISIVRDGQLQPGVLKEDFVDDFFGFSFDEIGFYLGMLCMYSCILVVAKMVANRYVRHQSR